MATEIGKGVVTMEADGDDVTKSVKKTLQEIQKAGEQAAKDASSKIGSFIDRNQKDLSDFGKKGLLATGILTAGLVATADAASSLSAAISSNQQVLGDSSKAVQDWAENSVQAVGLSKRAAIEATTGFGQLAKIAGETGDGVSGFSEQMVQLAADMAAFKDVGTDEALADLQSGFAGSTEVLRKYNIFLDDAGLKQAYFRETGEQVTGTLTAQQRVIATHSEIMRQSADMQGQWARESSGLQAQQSMLKANLENMAASIGQNLVPVFASVVSVTSQGVQWFGNLNEATHGLLGQFAGFAVAGLGAVSALALIASKVVTVRDRVKPLTDAVANLSGGYANLGKVMGGLTLGIGAYLALNSLVTSGEDEKKTHTDKYVDALKAQAVGQRDAVKAQIAADIANKDFIDTMHKLGLTEKDVEGLITSGKSLFDVGQQLSPAWEKAAAAIGSIRGDVLKSHFDGASASTKTWVEGLDVGKDAAGQFAQIVNDAALALGEAQGQVDLQTGTLNQLTTATDASTLATTQMGEAARNSKTQSEGYTVAVAAQKAGMMSLTEQIDRARQAEEDLYNFERSLVDSKYALERSTDAAYDATDRLNGVLKDSKSTLEDVDDASRDAADAAINMSEDYATLNGASLNSRDGVLRQIDSLNMFESTLAPDSPLRARIQDYINDLKRIPENVATELRLTTVGGGLVHGKSAEGGFYRGGSNYLTTVAENSGRYGDEVILPLGKPARMRSLLANPDVAGPIFDAAGHLGESFDGHSGGDTKNVNFYGDIVNTVDLQAAFQMANHQLAAL